MLAGAGPTTPLLPAALAHSSAVRIYCGQAVSAGANSINECGPRGPGQDVRGFHGGVCLTEGWRAGGLAGWRAGGLEGESWKLSDAARGQVIPRLHRSDSRSTVVDSTHVMY